MKRQDQRFPTFTDRFRLLQGDLSNTEFACKLGMSRQTVGFYANGDRIPDALGLKQIVQECGVSSDWLLGLSDTRTPDMDTQGICEKTGLSEKLASLLIRCKQAGIDVSPINLLFGEEPSFLSFLMKLEELVKKVTEAEATINDPPAESWKLDLQRRDTRYSRFDVQEHVAGMLDAAYSCKRIEKKLDHLYWEAITDEVKERFPSADSE